MFEIMFLGYTGIYKYIKYVLAYTTIYWYILVYTNMVILVGGVRIPDAPPSPISHYPGSLNPLVRFLSDIPHCTPDLVLASDEVG